MALTMYDSVEVGTVPDSPQAVAGYVGGNWPTYLPLAQKYPLAKHLSIAVQAYESARALDVETGDATDAEAPGWFNTHADKSQGKPIVYTFASNSQALINALAAAAIHRDNYYLWSAHWTYVPHICSPATCGYPTADLTQWTDHAFGRNLDASLVADYIFGPPPSPPDPHHYQWFSPGPFPYVSLMLNERKTVEEYDKLRAEQTWHRHPFRARLTTLRNELQFLANRVAYEAHKENPKVSVAHALATDPVAHRGWRYQQLIKRAQGERVV